MILNAIKMNFDFIKDKGYTRKVYSKNTDYEVYYTKQNRKILIGYQLSVPDGFSSTDIDAVLKHSYYTIDVIIKLDDKVENMLESSLFTDEEINDLTHKISSSKGVLETQIETYARFLKSKIDLL